MLSTDFRFGEVHNLSSTITPDDEKVRFQRIFENANGGVVLLDFKAGQNLPTHTAPAEVMVYVLEGNVEFTMLGVPHELKTGEFLLMGQQVQHSVVARTDTKIMLVKIKA